MGGTSFFETGNLKEVEHERSYYPTTNGLLKAWRFLEMSNVTVVTPTDLVQHASLSSTAGYLAQKWEERNGINPVVCALTTTWRNEWGKRVFVHYCILSGAILALVAFSLLHGTSFVSDGPPPVSLLIITGATIVAFVLYCVGTTKESCRQFLQHETQKKKLDIFCDFLATFCDMSTLTPKEALTNTKESLESMVDEVMKRKARDLRDQMTTRVEMSLYYDTFLSFGLVRPGGYGQYFDAAKKEE